MIQYEIVSVRPKQSFLQVRYFDDQGHQFLKNFNPDNFDSAAIAERVQSYVPTVLEQWALEDARPEAVDVPLTGTLKNVVQEDVPPYDPDTQTVDPTVVETATTITYGYTVRAKTTSELNAETAAWRALSKVTMRQCRLALAQQGKLGDVAAAINSLPPAEKAAVDIEWEYAAVVERKSPWVNQLGVAIGLDEVGLDNLFKLAETL